MTTVLFAVTGAPTWTMKDGTTLPSGFWAEELTDPYRILTTAGIQVRFATPGGVPAPLQAVSLDTSMTGSAQRSAELRIALDALADQLDHPLELAAVDTAQFDAVFIPGGTGPMQDLHADPHLGRILAEFQSRAAHIAAVCHGPAGLLAARDGEAWLFAGYEMTGYSDDEEAQGGASQAAPFTLETRLREQGARYRAAEPWAPFVLTDRNLITGQNPASAAEVARQLLAALSA